MLEALLAVAIALAALCARRLGVLLHRSGSDEAARLELRLQGLEDVAKQVAEVGRTSTEKLEAIGRQAAEDAQRTREELVAFLASFHRSLIETLREMTELHQEALRSLRRPVRQALTIREELRRAHDQREARDPGVPPGRSEASGAADVEWVLRPELGDPIQRQRQTMAPRPRRLAGLLGRVRLRTWGSSMD